MLIEVCLVCATIALGFFLLNNGRSNNYPPGPLRLPIIGNLHLLRGANSTDGGMSTIFTKLSEKYGRAFSMFFGSHRVVVLSDYKLIKDAWNNPLLGGRPRFYGAELRCGGALRGILLNDGDEWQEQRRFALRHLRDFGFGRRSMETLILDEVSEVVERLGKDAGQPVSTISLFNAAVLNSLWTIVAGDRFEHEDPKLTELVENIQGARARVQNPSIVFPWLVKAAPELSGFNKFASIVPLAYHYMEGIAQGIIKDFDGQSPQNFAHVFIQEMRKTQDPKSSFHGKHGEKTMAAVLMDLFQAGAETTSTTLSWFMLYMSVFPQVQKKLHREIDRVLGNKPPSLEDRQNMPYTEAAILETLRFSSLVPLGTPHRAMEDVVLDNYVIPKDTLVMANLVSCHFDPGHWTEPKEFSPERFLAADGTTVNGHVDGFLPFSAGKRVCLGERLARDELFLFVATILQMFTVTRNPKEPKPDLGKSATIIVAPKPHTVIFTQRQI